MDHAIGTGGLSHAETVKWMHRFQPDAFVGFNSGDAAGRLCLREMGKPGDIGDVSASKFNKKAEGSFNGYHVAEFTYPIRPKMKGCASWFYSLPAHDQPTKPSEKLFKDYQEAVKYGIFFHLTLVQTTRAGFARKM
jgi:alpha-L-fucosidase